MTVEEFLRARLDDVEFNVYKLSSSHYLRQPMLNLIQVNRDLLTWHESWPALIEEEPQFQTTYDPDNPDEMRYAIMTKSEWMTRKQYVERFGKEAPTAPFLDAFLRSYKDHPDFNPDWLK